VLKYTPDDSPDKSQLPKAVTIIRDYLARVNAESGKSENRFNLMQLDQQLVWKPGEDMVCIASVGHGIGTNDLDRTCNWERRGEK